MAMAAPLNMDRSRYMNPEMPVGYVKKNPELRYKEGIEINGVHYVWAPYIYEAHIEERADYATLSDLITTSDEERALEATINGTTLSHMDMEETGAKRKKLIKKKKHRSGSSSSSSGSRQNSPTTCKQICPSSHRSPSSHSRKHHIPSKSRWHCSPSSRDKIATYSPCSSPERYSPSSHRHRSPSPGPLHRHRHPSTHWQRSRYSFRDVKIKEEPLEPPNSHGVTYQEFHCELCNLSMNSRQTYNTHLIGKRHLKNHRAENMTETVAACIPPTVISDDQSKYPKAPSCVIRKKVKIDAKIQELLETSIETCPGLNFVTEIQGIGKTQYYCFICDSAIAPPCLIEHLTGFKHRLRSVKQFKPGAYEYMQNEPKYKIENELNSILRAVQKKEGKGRMTVEVEEMVANDAFDSRRPPSESLLSRSRVESLPSTSRGITQEQGTSFIQKFNKAIVPDRNASDYFCEICQSHMNSLQMWEAHIKGKRHNKNLKKMPSDSLQMHR